MKKILQIFTAFVAAIALGVMPVGLVHANSSYNKNNGRFVWYSNYTVTNLSDIYSAEQHGGGVARLTMDDLHDGNPQWHPISQKIVFDSKDEGSPGSPAATHSIYIMNKDGTNITKIVDRNNTTFTSLLDPGSGDQSVSQLYDPSFSPDGTKIAFQFTGLAEGSKVFIGDFDDSTNSVSNIQPMSGGTYLNDDISDFEPIWSADGTKLLTGRKTDFSEDTSPDPDGSFMHITNISDGSTYWVSPTAIWSHTPQFGPHKNPGYSGKGEGRDLIITIKFENNQRRVVVVDVTDPGNVTEDIITTQPQAQTGAPTWSPNGIKIAWGTVNGQVIIHNYHTGQVNTFQVQGYGGTLAEVDWTFGSGIPDVYIECTTTVGQSCTTDVPIYCTDTILQSPAHGTSNIQDSRLTYKPSGNKATEENYIHQREDILGNTASCFIKINFIPKGAEPTGGNASYSGQILGLTAIIAVATSFGVKKFGFRKFRRILR